MRATPLGYAWQRCGPVSDRKKTLTRSQPQVQMWPTEPSSSSHPPHLVGARAARHAARGCL
eukprot:scaffold124911_cov36-Tisochrysis_lutea.AAC.2